MAETKPSQMHFGTEHWSFPMKSLLHCSWTVAWYDHTPWLFVTAQVAITPNVVTFKTAISACEKADHWQSALHLFQAMPKAKVRPNVLSHFAARNAGNEEFVARFFMSAPDVNFKPKWWSYESNLSYESNEHISKHVISIFCHYILNPNIPKQSNTCIYLHRCPRFCARWTPELQGYNSTISACEKHWQIACHLFATMSRTSTLEAASAHHQWIGCMQSEVSRGTPIHH